MWLNFCYVHQLKNAIFKLNIQTMKAIITTITFFCLLCSFSGFSQADTTNTEKPYRPLEIRKNELKLGAVKLIAGPILDLEYERVLSSYSSLGANMVVALSDGVFMYDFSLNPYFRMYFTQSKEYGSKGFFAQAFMGYYTGKDYFYDYNANNGFGQSEERNWNSFGAGLGIGTKWVNKHGFVFQLVFGIGRNFIGDVYAQEIILQGDAYIGYRF